ncbi:signal peptidase I [uncultured Clostridium sp.]|uniref:signal peptidase I n=1 Tax=uncultured Clostridium sp. TaxID=59620 RepID=UPI00262EAA89|nr:signal peptidase I [uncultured Clostridium sp.]
MKFFKDWIVPVVCAVVIAFLINKFLIFKVEVPSGSMIPTVMIGDQIFVRKVYNTSKIERGDIVVFKKDGKKELLLKRVIGLPGENVEVKDGGNVYINGVFLDEPYVENPDALTGIFTVPMDSYLMMGDNRKNSEDARMWKEPYISEKNIIAKAGLRIYPFNSIGFLE